MDRVRWIGGSPCSGKSTLARRLAAASSALLYTCDDMFERHASAVTEELGPTLKKLTSMRMDHRLAQPIDVQVADVFRLSREEWPQILGDLERRAGNVVAEGATLLPKLLSEIGVTTEQAVWIVPTESFQRLHYARRPWTWELVQGTRDPAATFDRWMQRDARFATEVAGEAQALGYRVLVTDSHSSFRDHLAELGRILEPFH